MNRQVDLATSPLADLDAVGQLQIVAAYVLEADPRGPYLLQYQVPAGHIVVIDHDVGFVSARLAAQDKDAFRMEVLPLLLRVFDRDQKHKLVSACQCRHS